MTRIPATRIQHLLALLALAVVAAACGRKPSAEPESWAPADLTEVRGVPIAEIQSAVSARLAEGPPPGVDAEPWQHAGVLYEGWDRRPLWLTSRGLDDRRVRALTDVIFEASGDALRVGRYPLPLLTRTIAELKETRQPTASQLATTDVLLTVTYAGLGEDLLTGHIDPRSVSQSWHVDPREENVDSVLARGLRVEALDAALNGMRPQDPDYVALKQELRRYREIAASGGWSPVPDTEPVKPGEPIDADVAAALRVRLAEEGIALRSPPAARSGEDGGVAIYDQGLAAAVAQFQARHTIVVDSILGRETLDAMNRPATYRLGQIAANLERLRWMPRNLGARYISVNVPAFRLEAYDAGRKALEMRVIVGAEFQDRATPVFADSMSFVVFRPYWFVPDGIAEREILPRGPQYLAANNFEMYVAQGQTRVRQRPGPDNSLGLIKFIFPNDFAIYLHDTPNSELFDRDIRAFSHGCIRVERPDRLGEYVLGWPADSVRSMMENGQDDRTVNLERKIPVYITYITTFMRDGALHFGNDLYSRDEQLIEAVARAAQPDAASIRTIADLRSVVR
jgi:L,D-transpeptidase YcbB